MLGQILRWYFLFNKRLLKKRSFCVMLVLAPLLVAGIAMQSRKESGVVRIALCLRDPEDALATGIVDSLMEKDSVIQYLPCEEEAKAREMVAAHEADAAWIFAEQFTDRLRQAAADGQCDAVVDVVEREDTVTLQFSRQILVGRIYSDFSYMVYEDFVVDDMGLGDVSDEELREGYGKVFVEGSLFQLEYLDGQMENEEAYNYLLAPIRGILAIWVVLCGFAASLYFMQDERSGVLARVAMKNRLWMAFGMHAALLSDAAAVLLAGCKLAGVFTTWRTELAGALLLLAGAMMFSNLFRLLCGTPERLGACIPVVLVAMLVACPVFVGIRSLQAISMLFPPYYYLKSIHSSYHFYAMAVYTGVLFLLCLLAFWWRSARPHGI